MRKGIIVPLVVSLLLLGFVEGSLAAQMRAGVAKVDITPPEKGTPLSGYAARTSGSIGVLDPLYAKALVLECDGKQMALVTLDIISFPSERVPKEAEQRFGVGLVLLVASHTHFGPNFRSKRWPEPDGGEKTFRWTEDRVIEAIEKATHNMFPARLSLAKGEITLGYHRLKMQPNGRRKPLFQNPDHLPYGPVDPTVSLIRVENTDDETTRALLVGYACHPVCLASRCLLISADYPGAMMAKVEADVRRPKAATKEVRKERPEARKRSVQSAENLKEENLKPPALCMFVQGGAGSVNPYFIEEKSGQPGATTLHKHMGELLADEVLLAVGKSQPITAPNEIQWRKKTLTFADRWSTTGTVPVEMATVLINRTIGIAAVPGETFLSLQTTFKRDAPVDFPLFAGYTTSGGAEWPSYIPDIRAAAEGGYGADYQTHIEVGAAERIVNQAVIDLFSMKGMFSDKPAGK